jgi:hypothetical protein
LQLLQKIRILKTSNTYADSIQRCFLAKCDRDSCESFREAVVESPTDVSDRNVILCVAEHSFKQTARLDQPARAVGHKFQRIGLLTSTVRYPPTVERRHSGESARWKTI